MINESNDNILNYSTDSITQEIEGIKNAYRFPGTRPFTEFEEDLFFGRTKEVDDIIGSIKANTVFLIHGVSGTGKSSLINAGIIPKLRSNNFLPIVIRFGEQKNYVTIKPLERIIG